MVHLAAAIFNAAIAATTTSGLLPEIQGMLVKTQGTTHLCPQRALGTVACASVAWDVSRMKNLAVRVCDPERRAALLIALLAHHPLVAHGDALAVVTCFACKQTYLSGGGAWNQTPH